jgi:hypothetical protein
MPHSMDGLLLLWRKRSQTKGYWEYINSQQRGAQSIHSHDEMGRVVA